MAPTTNMPSTRPRKPTDEDMGRTTGGRRARPKGGEDVGEGEVIGAPAK